MHVSQRSLAVLFFGSPLVSAPRGFGVCYRGLPAFLACSTCLQTAKLRRLFPCYPRTAVYSLCTLMAPHSSTCSPRACKPRNDMMNKDMSAIMLYVSAHPKRVCRCFIGQIASKEDLRCNSSQVIHRFALQMFSTNPYRLVVLQSTFTPAAQKSLSHVTHQLPCVLSNRNLVVLW